MGGSLVLLTAEIMSTISKVETESKTLSLPMTASSLVCACVFTKHNEKKVQKTAWRTCLCQAQLAKCVQVTPDCCCAKSVLAFD